MNQKYPIYQISPAQLITAELERENTAGYLTKFWMRVPELGKSLIKFEENAAPAWSEKVSYELAKQLDLPAARYELGLYGSDRLVVVSPNFKQGRLSYIDGDTLIHNTVENGNYSVENAIAALEQNRVGLPPDWDLPKGIEDGADLLVGYLMLDSLIANNDRHGGNWEIGIADSGEKTLAPVFDNGASFGVDFGSLVYNNKTPAEYSQEVVSMWGISLKDAFIVASTKRPVAANAWLSRLEALEMDFVRQVFDRIPASRIEDRAKDYGLQLVEFNRTELLSGKELLATTSRAIVQNRKWQDGIYALLDSIESCLELAQSNSIGSKDYRASWDDSKGQITLTKNEEAILIARQTEHGWTVEASRTSSSDVSYWRKLETSFRLQQCKQEANKPNEEELEP